MRISSALVGGKDPNTSRGGIANATGKELQELDTMIASQVEDDTGHDSPETSPSDSTQFQIEDTHKHESPNDTLADDESILSPTGADRVPAVIDSYFVDDTSHEPQVLRFPPRVLTPPSPSRSTSQLVHDPIPISVTNANTAPQPIFRTDEESIRSAQKHATWAISALNYEDVEYAVKELQRALGSLGA